MSPWSRTVRDILWPLASLAAAVAMWQGIVTWFDLPAILLPGPLAVAKAAWRERVALGQGVLITAAASLAAFAICGAIGLVVAVAFSQSRRLRTAVFPYVVFLQTVPIVAIAPLLIIWSGSNFRTVVLVAVIIGLFPVISNSTSGLMAIPPLQLDLFRVYRAGRWRTLLWLRLPSAMPAWSLGLRISSGLVVIGAIVGEFFVGSSGSYRGLGTLITNWQARQYTPGLIAAVFATSLLGLLFFGLARFIGVAALGRWTRGRL